MWLDTHWGQRKVRLLSLSILVNRQDCSGGSDLSGPYTLSSWDDWRRYDHALVVLFFFLVLEKWNSQSINQSINQSTNQPTNQCLLPYPHIKGPILQQVSLWSSYDHVWFPGPYQQEIFIFIFVVTSFTVPVGVLQSDEGRTSSMPAEWCEQRESPPASRASERRGRRRKWRRLVHQEWCWTCRWLSTSEGCLLALTPKKPNKYKLKSKVR
jgi:hypothetical protein